MANTAIYEQALQEFNTKYNLEGYDLQSIQKFDEKFRYLNDFLMDKTIGSNSAEQFVVWATKTLKAVLETNSKYNEKGEYLPSFSLKQFVKDFDNLANAQYLSTLEEGQEPNREPYAGATLEALGKSFAANCGKFNKTLPSLWAEGLKNGTMDLGALETATNTAYDKLMDDANDKEKMNGELTNVIAAHEALKQLRESRKGVVGWFWKLFNRTRNDQEKELLKDLGYKIDRLAAKGYKVNQAQVAITGKTLMGQEVVKASQKEAVKTAETTKSASKSMHIKPVADKIIAIYNDNNLKGEMAEELMEKLPDNGQSPSQRKHGYTMLVSQLASNTFELNEQFDEAIANGGDPNKEMAKVVKEVFKLAASKGSKQLAGSEAEKIEGYGIIAKTIINKMTAAAIYPSEFSAMAETYVNKSVEMYKELQVEGNKDVAKAYDEQFDKEFVDVNERVAMFDDKNNPFVESSVSKSAPISQQPQHDVPTINTSK